MTWPRPSGCARDVSAVAAVFLDRDGVSTRVPDRLGCGGVPAAGGGRAPAPRVGGVCRSPRAGRLRARVRLQPARRGEGPLPVEDLLAVHARVLELLAREGVELGGSRLCMHHPEGLVPELAGVCACRKPAPGMLLDTAASLGIDLRASWMVGDTDTDVEAGRAAGCGRC